MFIQVMEQDTKRYYFPVTEISYIIEEGNFYTVVMKNGLHFRFEGELFIPPTV